MLDKYWLFTKKISFVRFSCLTWCTPVTLVTFVYSSNILIELFPWFFTQIFRQMVQMDEAYRDAHIIAKLLKMWQHEFNILCKAFILFIFLKILYGLNEFIPDISFNINHITIELFVDHQKFRLSVSLRSNNGTF